MILNSSTSSRWKFAICSVNTSSRVTIRRLFAAPRSGRSNGEDGVGGRKSTAPSRLMREYVPIPAREIDKPFLMPIEDIFSIEGRGTVVTGRIERGVVKVGEEVEIVGLSDTARRPSPASRCSRSSLTQAWRATTPAAPARYEGGRRARSGSRQDGLDHAAHQVQGRSLHPSKEEGGRHTPFFTGYRPQFYFRTTDVTGVQAAGRRRDGDAGRQRSRWKSSSSRRSRWKRACASRFAKAAAPWARNDLGNSVGVYPTPPTR